MSYLPSLATAAAGNNQGFLGFTGDRYMTGRSRSAPSSGASGSGMFRLWGIQDAAPTPGQPDSIPNPGDDGIVARHVFDSIADTSFDANMAVWDMTMAALWTGGMTVSEGGGVWFARNARNMPSFAGISIFQSSSIAYPSGSPEWLADILPRVLVRVMGRVQLASRTVAVFRIRITPQFSSYAHSGVTLSTGTHGHDDADIINYKGAYPLTLHRHVGTGAIATFDLDERPAGATYTAGWANGIPLTVSSINNATFPYGVTYNSNPAANAAIITAYQYLPSGTSS